MSTNHEELKFQESYYRKYASRYFEKSEERVTESEISYVKQNIRTIKIKLRQKRKRDN